VEQTLKIGKKGSKCDLSFFNISAKRASNLPTFDSIAWNFNKDGLDEEIIPVKCLLRRQDRNFSELNNLDDDENLRLKDITNPEQIKHFGLKLDLEGNTDESGRSIVKKGRDKIREIKLISLRGEAQQYCVNSFLVSMYSFAPLQFNYDEKLLEEWDKLLIKNVSKGYGLSMSDFF